MGVLRWFIGGLSEIFGTLGQILIAIILIPLGITVFSVLMPSSAQNYAMGLLTAIPEVGPAFNAMEMLWIQNQTQAVSLWDAIQACANIAYAQGFAGMCIGIFNFGFKLLMKLIHIDGVPVLTTLMGTFCGCLFLTAFPVHETAPYAIWTMCAMMFIGWAICLICVPGAWGEKIWAIVWTAYDIVIVSGCYMYVAVMQMMMAGDMAWGTFEGFLNTVYFVMMAIFPFLAFNVLQWIFWPKRKGLFDLLVP